MNNVERTVKIQKTLDGTFFVSIPKFMAELLQWEQGIELVVSINQDTQRICYIKNYVAKGHNPVNRD